MFFSRQLRSVVPIALCFICTSLFAAPGNRGASIDELTEQLQQDAAALARLSASIEKAPEQDKEALIFRRDERSFRLLKDLHFSVSAASKLPENAPERVEVMTQLKTNLQGAGEGVLNRIDDLGARIAALSEVLDSLSGVQLISTEAYIQSLETLRFSYYKALVQVIAGRQELGLSDSTLGDRLSPMLYLHSEAIAGRIEYTGGALSELKQRQVGEPGNTDLSTAIAEMSRGQTLDLAHLDNMLGLLEALGEDPVGYRAMLLEQGKGLSIATLETDAVLSLLEDSWDSVQQAFVDEAPDFLFRVLIFLIVILVARSLSNMTKKAVRVACDRPGVDLSVLLKDVLVSVCGGVVMVVGVLVALAQVGISLGPMLAGLGVAGFVVGFALQDTLGNFAAGGMILIYRPYDVDDFVEVAGASGLVKKMSLVSTTIATFDNQILVIPNSKIWGDVIKNVTAQKLRRVDLMFGIGYSDDIPHAERVLKQALEDHEKVLSKPDALIKVHELGDSSVNIAVRPWVKTEDYWDVYWDLTRDVKLRFDQEGISIPFPQRDVHHYRDEA